MHVAEGTSRVEESLGECASSGTKIKARRMSHNASWQMINACRTCTSHVDANPIGVLERRVELLSSHTKLSWNKVQCAHMMSNAHCWGWCQLKQNSSVSHNNYFEVPIAISLRVTINRCPRLEGRQESHLLHIAIIVSLTFTFLTHLSYLLANILGFELSFKFVFWEYISITITVFD